MERKYYDLTSAQWILFFSQKYTIHKQVNNICTSVLVDHELNFDILKKAIQIAYKRNDSLNLRIVKSGKDMKQYFEEYVAPIIEYLDFRGRKFEEMERILYKIAHKKISVYGKPMSKVYLMHAFDGKCGLFFVVSHMILDSWGISTFLKDVLSIYESLWRDTELPKPLGSYEKLLMAELDYKNTESYMKDREYFEKLFSEEEPIFTHINGFSVLEKYRKKHRNPDLRYARIFSLFTKANNMMLLFPSELVAQMEKYCMENKVPMQSLVLLAYRSYLSKVNRLESDICINSVIARRGTLQEKNTGGSRVHFLPFRTVITEKETFQNACVKIREKQADLYRHASMAPLEVLAMWKKAYNASEFQEYSTSAFTYQPVKLEAPGINIQTKWYGNGALGLTLYVTVMDGDGTGALKFYYEYQTHAVRMETIVRLHLYLMKAIQSGISNPEITIGELLEIE